MLLKDEVYNTVGAAMEVRSVLGSFFLEPVYQEAMEIELADRAVPFEARKQLAIVYKGRPLSKEYIADLLCCNALLLELKAIEQLTPPERNPNSSTTLPRPASTPASSSISATPKASNGNAWFCYFISFLIHFPIRDHSCKFVGEE